MKLFKYKTTDRVIEGYVIANGFDEAESKIKDLAFTWSHYSKSPDNQKGFRVVLLECIATDDSSNYQNKLLV